MGNIFESIDTELREWVEAQPMFFVATAPRADDGLINCSPKGLDTLRILDDHTIAYLDLTGSGIETVAHIRENGRIVLMMCAFEGPARIVRFQGTGDVVELGDPDYEALAAEFPEYPGPRAVVRITVNRISDTCGYGVPLMEFKGERSALTKWAEHQGDEALGEYRGLKNSYSLDGLPGLVARS